MGQRVNRPQRGRMFIERCRQGHNGNIVKIYAARGIMVYYGNKVAKNKGRLFF